MKELKIFMLTLIVSFTIASANAQQSIKAIGVLEFNNEGVLFAGDNLLGAIHAIDLSTESRKMEKFEINVYNVDAQVAALLGTAPHNVQINDLAVHPKSGEAYLSVTRGHGVEALPALIKVDAENEMKNIDLNAAKITSQTLSKMPDLTMQFKARGVRLP
ncbi:MAG: hypothetical protein AB8H12_14580 [Lewinella sp.]